jgi:hypothetical protein
VGETFFHFTTEKIFRVVEHEGLVPQPLKSFHPDMHSMCDDIGVGRYGVYIWPEVHRQLLRDFFIFKQMHERDVDAGLLLAVEVDPAHMLGRRWLEWVDNETGVENSLAQTHDLTFTLADGTERKEHRADMEVYLVRIPPENIEPIARIYQAIEPIDNSSLAVDLGLTR